jgi:hypothetical protein
VFKQIGFNVKEVGDIVCVILSSWEKQEFHFFKVEFLAFVTCIKITKTKGFFKVDKNKINYGKYMFKSNSKQNMETKDNNKKM